MKILKTQAASELKEMAPYLMIFNAAAVVISVIAGFIWGFDWRVFTGLIAGNAVSVANFLLIGVTVEKVVRSKDFRRGRSIAGASYGLRYAGMFAVLAGLLYFKLVSPVTALIPLIFPRIYYTFFYVRLHKEDDQI